MMVDTNIYGYVTDGAVWHPACLPDDINPAQDDTVFALFSHDDNDPHGLTCDRGDGYIFEPSAPHPYRQNPNKYGQASWSDPCWECGEHADDEQLHPEQPDTDVEPRNREALPDPLWELGLGRLWAD